MNFRLFPLKACVPFIILLLTLGCSSKSVTLEPRPLKSINNPLKLKQYFKKDMGKHFEVGSGLIQPLVLAQRIIVTDGNTQVRSVAVDRAKLNWRLELDQPLGSGVGGDTRHAVVATQSGEVSLIDNTSGELVWQTQLSSEALSPAALSRNWVVMRTIDGGVHGLDRSNGDLKWRYQATLPALTLRGTASPMIVQNQVLAAFANGRMVALNLETGELNWERLVSEPKGRTELERLVDIDGRFVVRGSRVYVVGFQGKVAALRLYSGNLIWEKSMSSAKGLTLYQDRVIVVDDQSYIWSLDADTGAVIWRQAEFEARGLSAPLMVGDFMVVGDYQGYVHWVDPNMGEVRARKRMGDAPLALSVYLDVKAKQPTDNLIVYTADAKLARLALRSRR